MKSALLILSTLLLSFETQAGLITEKFIQTHPDIVRSLLIDKAVSPEHLATADVLLVQEPVKGFRLYVITTGTPLIGDASPVNSLEQYYAPVAPADADVLIKAQEKQGYDAAKMFEASNGKSRVILSQAQILEIGVDPAETCKVAEGPRKGMFLIDADFYANKGEIKGRFVQERNIEQRRRQLDPKLESTLLKNVGEFLKSRPTWMRK